MKRLGQVVAATFESGAQALGGFGTSGQGGYDAARRSTRRTRSWRPGEGGPASDILPDLPDLRGRSRDLERNNPLALGAIQTKANGVVGAGLQMRSVIDAPVLGITDQSRIEQLQYDIEREWEIFEREADFTGQMHLMDLQRLLYWSGTISGDIGIARRWRKRPGETYGTRIVAIEADRIGNPNGYSETPLLQAGVALSADGEIRGYHVSDRHPGEMFGGALKWSFVPRRGSSGLLQFILAARVTRPGQMRGVPLFAPIEETLKQLGDYTAAEIKAAINDAYLFAFEEQPSELDDEGQPIITRPDGQQNDDAGELTLEDLTITTLPPGSKFNVKKPERPNTAFDGFVSAFCKQIGVALDLPYELLVKHFAASFSASRGALEIAYKGFLVEQAWFVRSVLDPIREWQFTEMVASGRFDAPGYFEDPVRRAAWLGREWIGPTRVQINPQVEAKADETDLSMGAKTLEQIYTERTGGSFDTKSKQILRERAVLGGQARPSGDEPNIERNNDGTDPEGEDE